MTEPRETAVSLPGGREARVWSAGSGEPLVFLGGLLGLPRWIPFLDHLAAARHVVAPSLPGFHGCEAFRDLDHPMDWLTATLDLLDAAAPGEIDLVGASIGGSLAAEVAAAANARVRRLALVAPLGVYRAEEPVADLWAQRHSQVPPLLSERPDLYHALLEKPHTVDEVEWSILTARALESAARLLWPLGDTGLAKRLHRIQCPTLLVWGACDRVVGASYAKHFAGAISGATEVRSIEGAGHMAELDEPAPVARAILGFLDA